VHKHSATYQKPLTCMLCKAVNTNNKLCLHAMLIMRCCTAVNSAWSNVRCASAPGVSWEPLCASNIQSRASSPPLVIMNILYVYHTWITPFRSLPRAMLSCKVHAVSTVKRNLQCVALFGCNPAANVIKSCYAHRIIGEMTCMLGTLLEVDGEPSFSHSQELRRR